MRFSLLQLLLFVATIALSLATFGPWGIAVTLFLLVQMLWVRRASDGVKLIAFWGILFVLGTCVVHGHREGYRISGCRNNLHTIGLALHSYHDQYDRFPPQHVADAEGRPMHSWRVLILPYLSESDANKVYQQYRFDEPWNGPNNQQLAAQLGNHFRCRTTNAAEPGSHLTTHYAAVTGPGTAWPGPTETLLEDIADGSDNTVMLVEIADSDIHWMEPRDVTLEEALSDRKGAYVVPSSHHFVERTYFFLSTYPLVGNVLMADGSCHCLERRPSRDDLATLLSVAGGEPIDADALLELHRRTLFERLDLKRCLSFALFLVLVALLASHRRPRRKAG